MNNNQGIQPVPIVYNQTSISLPLDENAFKEFMVSLLGQPESIEGYVEGAFEIDFGGFEYLNNLIDDRIAKQNQSSLIEFKSKLYFNDGSSISFNGVQSFLSYRELRPLICVGFVFTWSYLIKFNHKSSSEKQEITISSFEQDTLNTEKSKKKRAAIFNFDLDLSGKLPRINYYVRCTDKGWGIDITELICNCLSKFSNTDTSRSINLRKSIIQNFKFIQISCLFMSYFAMLLLTWQFTIVDRESCGTLAAKVNQFLTDSIIIDKKINFLIQFVNACNAKSSIPFLGFIMPLILAPIGSFLLPFLIYKLIQLPNHRFLLFTENSKKKRDEYFRKLNDKKTFWIITVLIGLIIGVVGNYIFTWLTSFIK